MNVRKQRFRQNQQMINQKSFQVLDKERNNTLIQSTQLEMRKDILFLSREMVNLLSWNIRGLNSPNKQKEIRLLCNEQEARLVGLLETKVKVNKIEGLANKLFGCWQYVTNLEHHYNSRIWITWRQDS